MSSDDDNQRELNKQQYRLSMEFRERYAKMTDQELIDERNRLVENPGWVGRKILSIHVLGDELESRGFDRNQKALDEPDKKRS
jgi:hypothetical protein